MSMNSSNEIQQDPRRELSQVLWHAFTQWDSRSHPYDAFDPDFWAGSRDHGNEDVAGTQLPAVTSAPAYQPIIDPIPQPYAEGYDDTPLRAIPTSRSEQPSSEGERIIRHLIETLNDVAKDPKLSAERLRALARGLTSILQQRDTRSTTVKSPQRKKVPTEKTQQPSSIIVACTADGALDLIRNYLPAEEQYRFREQFLALVEGVRLGPEITLSTSTGELPTLEDTKRHQEVEERAIQKRQAFANQTPSIALLADYIRRQEQLEHPSFDDKEKLVKTVNYWKKELKAEFIFHKVACSLEADRDAGQGTFRLRATSADAKTGTRTNLYSKSAFPRGLACLAGQENRTIKHAGDMSTVCDAASFVKQVRSLVDELQASESTLRPQVVSINNYLSQFDAKFDNYELKRELVDSLNQAKEFYQLKFVLTQRVGQLKKGTEVWLTAEAPYPGLPTGRFVFQQTETLKDGKRPSARSAHKLPIALTA